jgi:hypothetical protein
MSIWNWLLLGAGCWVLALVLKITVDFAVQRLASVELRDWAAASLSGVWSSLCELGLTAGAFLLWHATMSDALVFAVGAALAEFLAVLPAALSAHFSKPAPKSKTRDRSSWRAFFLERALVFANHLCSRTLLWFGIAGTGGLAMVAAAFGIFAVSEGTLAYGQARDWNWLEPRTQLVYFVFFMTLIAGQIALIVFWH